MTAKRQLLLSLSGAVALPLVSADSFSFNLVPAPPASQLPTYLVASAAGLALLGAWYWFNRSRTTAQAAELRIERQLQALEKLATQVGRAEQVLSLKCEFMTHQVRTELKDALYAITTDTIRNMGGLRRKEPMSDKQFSKLMAKSDEFFSSLERAQASEVTLNLDDDVPLLMPERGNPLPKPVPQRRPAEPMILQAPAPSSPASIPMPEKPRPKGANADAGDSDGVPALGLNSALVLGGGLLSGSGLFLDRDDGPEPDQSDFAAD
ncbi:MULTISPECIES: hypothetical protein [Pseudomonas]|uniref:Uncharacterized protein n=3 Tax=Pseudomonas TaxID=286 RepID=A0A3G1DGP0_PSEAI|nr:MULTISPECIES: hypothetical protein [Pseudomonas putida group]AMP35822.1 Hypothetical protein [Pseudomonas aeruginosa]MCO6692751.1 hypothetical protein [Pseudomonas shirazica]MCZ9640537.1 hypothetical protein [Pseudomonas putida]TRZ57600.1 hypothetical protein DZA28_28720 [Pseudomonas alloputida]HEE9764243.1 hypothetical protein [Pseudomonas putida]